LAGRIAAMRVAMGCGGVDRDISRRIITRRPILASTCVASRAAAWDDINRLGLRSRFY